MYDLSVVALGGRWVLHDDEVGELGAFETQAEALAAAREYAFVTEEPRAVLICDDMGEWEEALVDPPPLH